MIKKYIRPHLRKVPRCAMGAEFVAGLFGDVSVPQIDNTVVRVDCGQEEVGLLYLGCSVQYTIYRPTCYKLLHIACRKVCLGGKLRQVQYVDGAAVAYTGLQGAQWVVSLGAGQRAGRLHGQGQAQQHKAPGHLATHSSCTKLAFSLLLNPHRPQTLRPRIQPSIEAPSQYTTPSFIPVST